MKILLAFFVALMRPAVGESDPPQDLELDLDGGGTENAGDQGTETREAQGEQQEQQREEPDYQAQLAAEREARAADRDRADRYERELAEVRARPAHAAPDPQLEAEERVLRDPNATDLQKWQVSANRELRAGRSTAQSALAQAQDISDKTSFRGLEVKNPSLFKRYESRVEEEYQKLRAKGTPAPREAILRFLVGADALDGKLTRKPASRRDESNSNINRGRLPGARSDTNGRNNLTEREKRRARLENVNI